jgi:hypothetical protein
MNSQRSVSVWLLTLFTIIAPTFLGCGPDRPALGRVEGVVTLDKKPLAGATVSFKPQTGKGSFGITNQDGHYELFYIRDIKGAIVGSHTIRITTTTENSPKELIPRRYNVRSELEGEVKAGKNTLNFELSSESKKGR